MYIYGFRSYSEAADAVWVQYLDAIQTISWSVLVILQWFLKCWMTLQHGDICCSAEVFFRDQVIKGEREKKKVVSHYFNENYFFFFSSRWDVQKRPCIYSTEYRRLPEVEVEKHWILRECFAIYISHTTLSKTTEICPMKLQCCALYKWIHECIMRVQNEPRKAQWTNPPGGKKIIQNRTQFVIILRRETFLLLFKIHALNVKPALPYMYWVAYTFFFAVR